MQPQRLRIESVNGSPVNDYRIRDGRVELRLLDPSGRPYASWLSNWRTLDEGDLRFHFELKTVVSKWLKARLKARELGVSVLQTYHTGDAIPTSGVYRVYHRAHRLPQEVTLLAGYPFPRCSRCSNAVTFRAIHEGVGLEQRHATVLHELPEVAESEAA